MFLYFKYENHVRCVNIIFILYYYYYFFKLFLCFFSASFSMWRIFSALQIFLCLVALANYFHFDKSLSQFRHPLIQARQLAYCCLLVPGYPHFRPVFSSSVGRLPSINCYIIGWILHSNPVHFSLFGTDFFLFLIDLVWHFECLLRSSCAWGLRSENTSRFCLRYQNKTEWMKTCCVFIRVFIRVYVCMSVLVWSKVNDT